MIILLIEDNEFKKNNISKHLSNNSDHKIEFSESVNGALTKLLDNKYDLVILDMSLPTFDNSINSQENRPQGYGGREILRQMDRFNIFVPVIVITQYAKFDDSIEIMSLEDLTNQLHNEHGQNVKKVIYYSSSSDEWKIILDDTINYIRK